jgi:hypothetical protein
MRTAGTGGGHGPSNLSIVQGTSIVMAGRVAKRRPGRQTAMSWSNSLSGAAVGRGLARAALLLVPLALAACGSVAAGGGAGSAGAQGAQSSGAQSPGAQSTGAQSTDKALPLPPPLCADLGAVNHLVVRRTGIIPHVQDQRFTFPALVTVTSAVDARAVATALCALPAQPGGIVNCPNDLGIGYQLRFAAGRHHFHVVTLQTTGCEIVSGVGKPRTIVHSSRFWAVLGQALRLRLHFPLAQQAFAGPSAGG